MFDGACPIAPPQLQSATDLQWSFLPVLTAKPNKSLMERGALLLVFSLAPQIEPACQWAGCKRLGAKVHESWPLNHGLKTQTWDGDR
ncbi:MAG: hypothetical protein EA001_06510 [Oscillatoriales cyanobacterium]|nr:MAG: hypothetical protein EA001_06510 [Oscillatoriales cyanobacterium]